MPDMTDAELSKIKRAARDPVTGKSVTVPGDMTYQEWYAKYVTGNAQAEANKQATQNLSADRRQFERYRSVLGEDAAKTLAEFQRIKYNNSNEWNELQASYTREKLKADIRAGKYNLTVNPEKQARHILDSNGYIPGRSYLNSSEGDADAVQALVPQYAGTGEPQLDKKGKWRHTEVVALSRPIGWVVRKDGTEVETNRFKIHYSGTGIHIVPFEGCDTSGR